MNPTNANSLIALPKDVFLEICSYLSAKDLSRLGRVSIQLAKLVCHPALWKKLVQRDFTINRIPSVGYIQLFQEYVSQKVRKFTSSEKACSEASCAPENRWHSLYYILATKWSKAKTIEDKKEVARAENLDIKEKEILEAEVRYEKAKQKRDNLCTAIGQKDAKKVSELLASEEDLEPFRISSSFTFIADGLTPLNLAAFGNDTNKSIIFQKLLEKVKRDKDILKLNNPSYPTFLSLLINGRHSDALSFIQALENEVDHLFEERCDGGSIFHALANVKSMEGIEIAKFLFGQINDPKKMEKIKKIVSQLMLTKTTFGYDRGLPLHHAIEHGNLALTQLYIQKLRELGILNQCLDITNESQQTPLDLIKIRQKYNNWPEDIL